ncbi:MAG: hypothetical protein IJD13_00920, partial [Oscillospiraceae bacterium]|nr:hypothetical protein [Oscillospiraceae bacterium]
MQNEYDFRTELMQWHRPGLRCAYTPGADEICLENATFLVPENGGEVLLTAAKDFQDYLFTSMEVSAGISRNKINGTAVRVGTYAQLNREWDHEPVAASY